MNYFKFFSIVTIAVILGLTSCKEGDTDTRELTGTWKTMDMKINKTKLPLVLITSTYSINSANELHLVIDALNITKAYLTALGAPYDTQINKITKAEISCWYKK